MNTGKRTQKIEGRTGVPPRRATRRTWSWLLRVALLVAPVLAFAASVQAQVPAATAANRQLPPKTFMSKNVFYLPVIIEDRVRNSLREVQLYVKDNPSHPWMLKEKAPPTQTGFTYKGTQDGEYWFAVVTVDKSGRMTPADLGTEPPGLIVVLDTQSPQLDARPLPSSSEGQFVRCEVRDANPDTQKTRLEYQTGDKMWRTADLLPNQADTYVIPHQAVFTGMVRVSATDRAGNNAVREINIGAMAAVMNGPASTPAHTAPQVPVEAAVVKSPPCPPPLPVIMSTDSGLAESVAVEKGGPVLQPTETVVQKVTPLPSVPQQIQSVVCTESTPKRITTPATRSTNSNMVRQLVNNTHVFLEYQIEQMGPSGVGKVEVWLTKDHGQSWQKLGEDADRKSPVEIDLPGEGLFGVSLVVSNGRGFGGTPPTPGDAPDWWIEVDITKPTAEILGVQPAFGQDDGGLAINWTARDKNLAAEPIDLYYSATREGPWQVIAKDLKNDGHYRWAVPPEVGAHAYLRIVVTDRAGNSTQVETAQPVALDDLSRPRGHVIGVVTTRPRGAGPVGN